MGKEFLVGIISGVISGTIVSFVVEFFKAMREAEMLHRQFSIMALRLIDRLKIELGKDVNHSLLKCFLLGENSITQETLNSEMLKMIKIRNKVSLEEIHDIYERYNDYIVCSLYKSRKKEMKDILREIEELIEMISIQCFYFERHLKGQDYYKNPKEIMFELLSKIYKKTYKIEQTKSGPYSEKILYFWHSDVEHKILMFFKKIKKNQDAKYREHVYSYSF